MRLQIGDEGIVEFERQQVRIGEIAVVVRLFLGTQRPRLALAGIVEAGLLVDRAPILENADLAAGLDLDRLTDEADRVDVLDLAAGAEGRSRLAHGDVDVGAQIAFLHVAVARADIAQDGAQLGDIGLGLVGRAQVRLGDDLHQRHARAVEIDEAHGRVLVVHRLAGVLLQMQALDADADLFGRRQVDRDLALADDRMLVLADLVALRQVGVEVVLAVEDRALVDLGVEAEPGANRLAHAFLVDHWQHARHRRVDQADMGVRLAAEGGRGAREQLGVGRHLRMDLETDHDFPVAGRTLDQLLRVGGTDMRIHETTSMRCCC